MFYYLVGAILWFIYASYKLQGHNYHQYPLMPLISFMIAYFLIFLSVNISNIFKTKKLKVIIILLALILLISPMTESKNRMYDTQFVGLDIAGDYIKENKLEGERVMHSSHQAYGLLWHGNIKGTRGIPDSVEKMENARVNLSANWLFIYSWDLQILSEPDERSSYIRENYEVKQIAFNVDQNGQLMPVYLLLKYGGPFSENDINEAIKEGPVLTKPYEFSFGTRDLNYVNV